MIPMVRYDNDINNYSVYDFNNYEDGWETERSLAKEHRTFFSHWVFFFQREI